MGAVAGCTDRKCCGTDGGGEAAYIADGKTMWTLDGIERLPHGVACLRVTEFGIEPPIPISLQAMMIERSRADEFRLFCGRLLNFGVVKSLDVDAALMACAPGFARTGIELFLTGKPEDSSSVPLGRWFVFVDRRENSTFTPVKAMKVAQRSSVVKNILGGVSYEFVQTKEGYRERNICDKGAVNFSGSWTEVATEGDMDAFLRDMGWTKIARTISSSIKHGVGRSEQHIDHKGDWLCITQISPALQYTSAFTIGGGMQTTINAEGRTTQVKPNWVDDGVAVVTPHWDASGELVQITKRYLRDSPARQMVLEMTSPAGIVVKRIWVPLVNLEDDCLF